ncbi:MAG: hypothetical protein IJO85_07335 [Lachnospiraceae bacterium]|nr:hypothetical protein [Lachnospiraceae bacterium]
MTKNTEVILQFLKSESEKGKKSFTRFDLIPIAKLSDSTYEKIINELEENGYIEVQHNIASTFRLI